MKVLHISLIILFLVLFFVAGFFSGVKLLSSEYGNAMDSVVTVCSQTVRERETRLYFLTELLKESYVDSVDVKNLEDVAIKGMLSNLDPYSVFLPKKEANRFHENMGGSFSGVGIEFSIINDTCVVLSVISGGPSERVGILPGDKIVEINDSIFVGKDIDSDVVMNKLRGQKGTKVKVGVHRLGYGKLIDFDITRGEIPLNSVDAYYKIDDSIGYIKIGSFKEKSSSEFVDALNILAAGGIDKLIVDLRGNGGGYMYQSTEIANFFLEKDRLIVYTDGSMGEEKITANGLSSVIDVPIVVLVDEWSASASEIFAGAIQDNDRGYVVGRRTFGKGLVQQCFPLGYDGDEVKLTIAKYYTPSGRCIQKPYGDRDAYEYDIENRLLHGELDSKDSMLVADSLKFRTKNGRVVYGGGGIMPDIFVPRDTSGYTSYLAKVFNSGLIYEFAFEYCEAHKSELTNIKSGDSAVDELVGYLNGKDLCTRFVDYANKKGVRGNIHVVRKSKDRLETRIKSLIARQLLHDDNVYYKLLQENDPMIKTAIETLNDEAKQNALKIVHAD